MYVDIVISNVFNLNKHFFFFLFLFLSCYFLFSMRNVHQIKLFTKYKTSELTKIVLNLE